MASRRLLTACILIALGWTGAQAATVQQNSSRGLPWGPERACRLNPSRPGGLHPDALTALRNLALAHRITQGLNNDSTQRGNVHYSDGKINGADFTGAVDISVRCLTEAQIKTLLGRLAEAGFAAWYRKDGEDDWRGPPHIHAVWAGCSLKTFLRWQVESWIRRQNGLREETPYRFWAPSDAMIATVQALYQRFN